MSGEATRVVQTIPTLHKQWVVSLSIKVLAADSHYWDNIFRIGQGGNYWEGEDGRVLGGLYGDSSPSIWFHEKSSKLVIELVNKDGNYDTIQTTAPLNEWQHIELSQLLVNGAYQMRFKIGKDLNSPQSSSRWSDLNPRFFKDMKVYVDSSSNVEITNLNITTFYEDSASFDVNNGRITCGCSDGFVPVKDGYVHTCKERYTDYTGCPEGWTSLTDTNTCFKVTCPWAGNYVTWSEASAICQSDGGHLISPASEAANLQVYCELTCTYSNSLI